MPTDADFSFNPGMESFTPDLGKYSPQIAAFALRARFGFVHRFGRTVENDRDLERMLGAFFEENREMFPRPVRRVRVVEITDPAETMMQTVFHFRGRAAAPAAMSFEINSLAQRDLDPVTRRLVTFRPNVELRRALNKIRRGEELSFAEEYMVESLWHEMLHMRAEGVTREIIGASVDNPNLLALETAQQFVARRTYQQLMETLGGDAVHQREIIQGGWGYPYEVRNLGLFLRQVGVDEGNVTERLKEAVLTKNYSSMFDEVGRILADASDLALETTRTVLDNVVSTEAQEEFLRFLNDTLNLR